MPSLSWSAVIAAILGAVAIGVSIGSEHDPEAGIIALASITFALLSHRDT